MILNINHIDWNVDNRTTYDLPTELRSKWNDADWNEDDISDWLSDEYGWFVNGFCIEFCIENNNMED